MLSPSGESIVTGSTVSVSVVVAAAYLLNAQARADLEKLLQLDPNNQYAKDAREFLKDLK